MAISVTRPCVLVARVNEDRMMDKPCKTCIYCCPNWTQPGREFATARCHKTPFEAMHIEKQKFILYEGDEREPAFEELDECINARLDEERCGRDGKWWEKNSYICCMRT